MTRSSSLARLCAFALLTAAVHPAPAQEERLRGTDPSATAAGPRMLPETLGDAVGPWELSLDGSGRRCALTLSGDSGPNGRVLRFAAECRRTLPVLAEAAGWLFAGRGIRIVDGNVFPLLALSPRPDARGLSGKAKGGETYSLVPLATPAAASPPAEAPTPEPRASAQSGGGSGPAAAPPAEPARAPAIPDLAAGRGIPGSQPVLRADVLARPGAPQAGPDTAAPSGRDGPAEGGLGNLPPGVFALDRFAEKDVCRIELAPKPALGKARSEAEPSRDLAPAHILPGCRDGGIGVFDPVSWRYASGHLTLKAKRGHAINLVPAGDGSWRRDPEVGTTFVLRKLAP